MKIRITWLATNAVLDLQESDSILGPQTTFLEIKGFIKMRYGFKPQQLLLVCDQVLCEDDETLKQYGLTSTEAAATKVIGCHVFSMEEAEKEQKELEQEKAFEEEQKARDKRRAEEARQKKTEHQHDDDDEEAKKKKEQEETAAKEEEEEEAKKAAAKKASSSSILSYNHDDYQKALKILGKAKFAVSESRKDEVSNGNAPTHRPKFLDEQKSAKQMQLLKQQAEEANKALNEGAASSSVSTGGQLNYTEMVRTSEEWRGREAEKLRRIFKFVEYGDRRKEADEFFKIDYPNYPDGPIELWDIREDIMGSIASGADQKPLIIELFYFCEVEKGIDLNKLGEIVQMKLEQKGLRVKMLGVREAGCTYPLVAVAVTGETPAEIFQLGEVFFEEFGNADAVSTEQGMQSSGAAPAPQEGCSIQ